MSSLPQVWKKRFLRKILKSPAGERLVIMKVSWRSLVSKVVWSLSQSCPPSGYFGRTLISKPGVSHLVILPSSPPVPCVLVLVTREGLVVRCGWRVQLGWTAVGDLSFRLTPGNITSFCTPSLNWSLILILSSKDVLMRLKPGVANPTPFQGGDSSPHSHSPFSWDSCDWLCCLLESSQHCSVIPHCQAQSTCRENKFLVISNGLQRFF